ncbi:hypothetical protein M5D96_008357 [Drosophila gunungcola]|uniref:V-type proton ATPase subunit C n=1 Tax=Drosophila gunungcola TaxID=103775 RepID=A0A9P9YKZ1_9MUSC|nr:hypothetical protein M5D96_008357 [Drosophila gunungcola]
MMSEYWIISAPGDKTCQQTYDTMNNLTSKQHNLCNNYKFHIPDLKVGTLDQLVGLSDDLGKLDTYVEQITRKVANYLGEVLEDQRDKLHENLMANNSPGPPDDSMPCRHHQRIKHLSLRHQRKHQHTHHQNKPQHYHHHHHHHQLPQDLKGKSAGTSSPATPPHMPSPPTLPSACACDVLAPASGSLSGGSLTNLSSGHDAEPEPEFDGCPCDECFACAPPSTSATASTLLADECYSQTASSMLSATRCALSTVAAIATGSGLGGGGGLGSGPSTSAAAAAAASHSDDEAAPEDGETDEDPKSPHSVQSDLSDTFDWWFNKPKRNSKKSRSSPVSSCCGSSSQGRSSPDTDPAEPPEFPLSPAELPQYLTRFQWDMAKYPIKQSLRNIADIISKQIGQIDGDLKTKSQAYNNLKGNLQNLEKKKTGSLLTRNLADLVKKEHFILDSEYLTTLLVIVPKVMANDWLTNYEKITDMIVPRSSQLIQEDNDYCLFNVTLFKKVAEEFKLHARERKFIVRDFVYNEEELAAGKNEMTKLMTDKKKQFGPLVRWLKVNFSEAFCALIHVKALRVFVESVLRYGLPVNFQAILIEPNKKSVKRLRDVLNQLYGHLDGASAGGAVSSADNVDIPGLGFGQSEYFPYVFYKVNIDMVEQAKV